MEKFCQSCSMPLTEENLGSEKDGSKSVKYCNLCYLNGEFLAPNMTFEEMVTKGLDGIENSAESKWKKWLLKKSYRMMLKKTERWK